ncbi:MAG: hypothetical protein A2784_01555 [Candidatus Chisholmbacteria bacterium RIFCSPHIGHO2_01_FULL_48_12]|uniref:Protein kinase domain-containing protein n=1 Tax=Candidatus Chisholmbacteria bacterium RIFCSPHIGHO2_01_FULL_48_12 TaxID=1797589 RepID=A0A1G1VK37_9BACT|nr:MAG: hypothetical protein A2784_01555 [Candidatus Chisholmbacteria bacterium RIFCSPHIGHO2_01_FULL_48_12]
MANEPSLGIQVESNEAEVLRTERRVLKLFGKYQPEMLERKGFERDTRAIFRASESDADLRREFNDVLDEFEEMDNPGGRMEQLLPRLVFLEVRKRLGATRLGGLDRWSLYDEARCILSEESLMALVGGDESWTELADRVMTYKKQGPFYFSITDAEIIETIKNSPLVTKAKGEREGQSYKEKYEASVALRRKEIQRIDALPVEEILSGPETSEGEFTGQYLSGERGTYKVGRLIGEGHEAGVYEVTTETFTGEKPETPLVIKISISDRDEQGRQNLDINFRQAIETLRVHKDDPVSILARYVDSSDINDDRARRMFLVMEGVRGLKLDRLLDRSKCLSEKAALELLDPFLDFVIEEEGQGRTLRDFKTEDLVFVMEPKKTATESVGASELRLRLLDYGWGSEAKQFESDRQRAMRRFMVFFYRMTSGLPIDVDSSNKFDPEFLRIWIGSEEFQSLSWGAKLIMLKSQGIIDGGYESFDQMAADLLLLSRVIGEQKPVVPESRKWEVVSSEAIMEGINASVVDSEEVTKRLNDVVQEGVKKWLETNGKGEIGGDAKEKRRVDNWRTWVGFSPTLSLNLHNYLSNSLDSPEFGLPMVTAYLKYYPDDQEVRYLQQILTYLKVLRESGLYDRDNVLRESLRKFTNSLIHFNDGTKKYELVREVNLKQGVGTLKGLVDPILSLALKERHLKRVVT